MAMKTTKTTLDFWKENEKQIPFLAKMAKMILGIPASKCSSERSFSTGKHVLEGYRRTMLSVNHLSAQICCKVNHKHFE